MNPRRRILLCATGMSPQIVTETLYALAIRPAAGQAPWMPDAIHLISTTTGANQAKLNLLNETTGWFHQLCRDYTLPAIEFNPSTIHCIQNAQGMNLDDIRSPHDNEAAANSIAELVRQLTQDAHTELHVSLAGGRKTMGYYLGYALSLYGRPQDKLSHILVSGAFENHPEFYYPTPHARIIQTRGDKPQALNCADAIIELAEIPFVRLRDGLPNRLLDGKANFTETVQIANLAQQPAHLHLNRTHRRASVNDIPLDLNDIQFTLLLWFAQRVESEHPHIHLNDDYQEFIELIHATWPQNNWQNEDQPNSVGKAIAALKTYKTEHYEYFKTPLSRLNKALRESLGQALAERVMISKPHRAKNTGHSLPSDLKITIDTI